MKKFKKTSIGISLIAIVLVGALAFNALAAPSIADLHDTPLKTSINPVSPDGTNTAPILSTYDIYTNTSISDQYKKADETGKLVDTPVSNAIDEADEDIAETNTNGLAIAKKISTVEEILNDYCKAANVSLPTDKNVDIKKLDQITYFLDFKYVTTDYRVESGVSVAYQSSQEILDNGGVEATINGGELMKGIANINDYMIIQINAETGEIHYLDFKEYDKTTGTYVVVFPCVGPYMITQKMDR